MKEKLKKDIADAIYQSYKLGFLDGLKACAWWADGEEYVGTCGTTLNEASNDLESSPNFRPPKKQMARLVE